MVRFAVACAIAVAPSPADATEAGLDVGWIVAAGTVQAPYDMVESSGVGWVRINFRLDAWNAPDDSTPRGPDQLTWFQAYDRVIDGYVARGFQVYGLLNDEALSSVHPHGSDPWIADFVGAAVKIVDHFKDRVRVYEVINEPNDFAGGPSARFTARAFAKILQDTYLAVRYDAGHATDRCWQVDLVSGPLFSFDGTSAADYLAEVYAAGRGQLAWDYTHQVTGRYPLDGIGYHIYVAQGAESTVADVRAGVQANLGEVRTVVTTNEGATTSKQFWVSEFGFRADVVGAAGQADRLAAAFDAMRDTGTVAMATYFTLQDFPDNEWGILDGAGTRRTSADRLAIVSAANRAARGAHVTSITAPTLAAGTSGDVTITLENRGSTTWTSSMRLAAATGCPDSRALNEIAWEPTAGYANGVLDARVFLPADVPPGGTVALTIPVRAPLQEGSYRFAARMVDEGAAWFGTTALVTIAVTAAGTEPDDETGDPTPAGCGGCGSTGNAGLAMGLFAFRRRRTARDMRPLGCS